MEQKGYIEKDFERIENGSLSFLKRTHYPKDDIFQRRLAAVLRDSNDAITLISRTGKILAWNRGAEKMYGYSEAEALYMNFQKLFPKRCRHDAARILRAIDFGEIIESYDTQRITKQGKIIDVWMTITAIYSDFGEFEGIATTERDITDRKVAERKLKATEAKLRESNERLKVLARVDDLTHVNNRRYFIEQFKRDFLRAKRHGHSLAVIISDIDYFKQYNDTYGHQSGDICLQRISAAVRNHFKRASDLVGRLGGEEFAVVINYQNREEVEVRLKAFLDDLNSMEIPHAGSPLLPYVTMSAGVANYHGDDLESDPMAFLRKADRALYKAKENGRNQFVSDYQVMK